MSSPSKVTFETDLSVFAKIEWKFARVIYYRTLLSKKAVKQLFFLKYCTYFEGRNFRWENFGEAKISRKFRVKLSQMTNIDTFYENLAFANDYFKW